MVEHNIDNIVFSVIRGRKVSSIKHNIFIRFDTKLEANISEGNGSININPNKKLYSPEENVKITAESSDGYYLSEWNYNNPEFIEHSGINSKRVQMRKNTNIQVSFEKAKYVFNIHDSDVGGEEHITPDKEYYDVYDDEIQITAEEDINWQFDGWTILQHNLFKDIAHRDNALVIDTSEIDIQQYRENLLRAGEKLSAHTPSNLPIRVQQGVTFNERQTLEIDFIPNYSPELNFVIHSTDDRVIADGILFVDFTEEYLLYYSILRTPFRANRDDNIHEKRETFTPIEYELTQIGERTYKATPYIDYYSTEQEYDVHVDPGFGFEFDRWSSNLPKPEEEDTYFIPGKDRNIIAYIEPKGHFLTVEKDGKFKEVNVEPYTYSIDDNLRKDIDKGKTYLYYQDGETVNVNVETKDMWRFAGYSGDIDKPDHRHNIEIDMYDMTHIIPQSRPELITRTRGLGTILFEPSDYNQNLYDIGKEVDLKAVPDRGFELDELIIMDKNENIQKEFKGEDITEERGERWRKYEEVSITMDEPKIIEGVFAPERYRVVADIYTENTDGEYITKYNDEEINFDSHIIATADEYREKHKEFSNDYYYNDFLIIEAKAGDGWQFSHWDGYLESNNPRLSMRIKRDIDLKSVFLPRLDIKTEGKGKVNVTPDKEAYKFGETVEIEAIPEEEADYRFSQWTAYAEDQDSKTTTVTMDGPKEVKAYFEPRLYELKITTNLDHKDDFDKWDYINIEHERNGLEELKEGDKVIIETEIPFGYSFIEWSEENDVIENIEEEIIERGIMRVDEGRDKTAVELEIKDHMHVHIDFKQKYQLVINQSGDGNLKPEPGIHYYKEGERVKIDAEKGEEDFVRWFGDVDEADYYDDHAFIEMDDDKTVYGIFDNNPLIFKYLEEEYKAKPGEIVEINLDAVYKYGSDEKIEYFMEDLPPSVRIEENQEGTKIMWWIAGTEYYDETEAHKFKIQ